MMTPMKVKELHKLSDINLKMKLATNVLNAVELELVRGIQNFAQWSNMFTNEYDRCYGYLCYKSSRYFKALICKSEPCETFLQYIKEQELSQKLSYWTIREIIYGQYRAHIIPTRHSTTEAFKAYSFDIDVSEKLDNLLNEAGFIWRQLPNTNKAIIVEKEENVFKRHRYLNKIKQYRLNNKQIVYVEKKLLRKELSKTSSRSTPQRQEHKILIAASPQLGLINVCFVLDFDDKTVENLIFDTVASTLQPSVIVYEETFDRTDGRIPTIYDSKSEMIKWLERNNIPCDPSMHRADLYALIMGLTPKPKPLYCIEDSLKVYGHEVLQIPAGLSKLSYFYNFWDDLKDVLNKSKNNKIHFIKDSIKDFIENCTKDKWKKLENELIDTERLVYGEDMEAEVLTDNLLTMAKYEKLEETDLDILDYYQPDDLKDIIIA